MNERFRITEISDHKCKSIYTRKILELLPEWFGNKQALDEYVENVKPYPYWAALDAHGNCIGFFSVKIHYNHTGEIFVCGILPEHHRCGVGKELYRTAEHYLMQNGCKYVVVKTLSDTVNFEPYARTRKFYEKIGFIPTDEEYYEDEIYHKMMKIMPTTCKRDCGKH